MRVGTESLSGAPAGKRRFLRLALAIAACAALVACGVVGPGGPADDPRPDEGNDPDETDGPEQESIRVDAGAARVVLGGHLALSAEGAGQSGLTWEASHGRIEGAGDDVTYVAPPDLFGPVTITARSAADAGVFGTATVMVEDDLSVELAFYNTGRLARLAVQNAGTARFEEHTTVLFEHFEDAFDFIFTYRYDVNGICGYVPVRQDVSGIGLPQLDHTGRFGSEGRLRGVPYIGIPPTDMIFPYRLVVQSLTKAWANWVVEAEIPNRAGPTQPYWGFTSAAGVMGGFDRSTLKEVGEGVYDARLAPGARAFTTTWAQVKEYSPIELYLMGLVPADQVEPLLVAINPEWVDNSASRLVNGLFRADGFHELTIDDIIAEFGPRTPAADRTEYRAMNVLITDVVVPQEFWEELDDGVAQLAHRDGSDYEEPLPRLPTFAEMTGGRAFLNMGDLMSELKESR